MNDSRPTTPTVNLKLAMFEGPELEPIQDTVDDEAKRLVRRRLPDGSDPLVSVDGRRVSDFDSPVARAVAAVLEQMADPEFMRTAELSPAWVEAETSGFTAGPTTSGIELSSTPDSIPEVVGSPVMPIRSPHPDMACSAFGSKFWMGKAADGRPVVVYLDCDECDGCLKWRRHLNVVQFAHVCTKTATVVEIPQLATVDAARAVATRLSRFTPGTRVGTLQRGYDYLWTLWIVCPTLIDHGPIADAMERWEILGTIVDRPVTPAEFSSRCPLEKTAESTTETRANGEPKRRQLVRFYEWADYAVADPSYRLSDGQVDDTPMDDVGSENTPLTVEETRRSKLPIQHQQYLYAREWLPEGSRLNVGLWDDLVNALDTGDAAKVGELIATLKTTYHGPTRLLRDAAGWLIDGADSDTWREGWRPVFDAVGRSSPLPHCCQCGRRVPQQSDDGVCTPCKVEAG